MAGRDLLLVVLCMGIVCATVEAVFRRPPYNDQNNNNGIDGMKDAVASQDDYKKIPQRSNSQEILHARGVDLAKRSVTKELAECLKKLKSKSTA